MKEAIKLDRRSRLIDKAEEVFFAKGYINTSMSDIGHAANCSRTTLYKYFQSKENIYFGVVRKSFEFFIAKLNETKASPKNGLDKLLLTCENYLLFWEKHPKHYQIISDYFTILKDINVINTESEMGKTIRQNEFYEEIKELANTPFRISIEMIKEGQADLSITTRFPPKKLFLNMWAILVGSARILMHSDNEGGLVFLDFQVKDWKQDTLDLVKSIIVNKET
jgi:AcrR family transcriptional regulator